VGVGSTDHRRPSQRSATDWWELFVRPPTATQSDIETHDTPFITAPGASGGSRCIDHVRPFQRSISCCGPRTPTAIHHRLVHATAFSIALTPAGVRGVRTVDQRRPFQRSARTRGATVALGSVEPTARQLLAELHDTPLRIDIAGEALGACSTLQLPPSQLIASGEVSPCPTATQAEAETHDTA
jgi:hypothetical protein